MLNVGYLVKSPTVKVVDLTADEIALRVFFRRKY